MRATLFLIAMSCPLAAVAQDACPTDPDKTEPGLCGCDVTDSDWDADGQADSCIDDLAVVALDAEIGFRARIDAGANVGAGARVGSYAQVGPGATLSSGATVADRATVGAGATIGTNAVVGRRSVVGQDAVVGADSVLSRAVTWGAGTTSGSRVSVGYGSAIGADGVLASDVIIGSLVAIGDGADMASMAVIARGATLGDNATLGAGTVLGPDVTFGHDASLGASVRVRKGTTFGIDARIGMGSRVGRDVTFADHARIAEGTRVGALVTGGDYAAVEADSTVPRGTDLGEGVNTEVFTSCAELYQAGIVDSGVYTIDPQNDGNTLDVYCEQELYGGGWTLISNRRQDTNNVETCGGSIRAFFTSGCGLPSDVGASDSYALPASDRGRLAKTQMMMLQYRNGVLDADDAVRIDLGALTEPFPDTGNTVVATAVDRICRPDGTNCDASQTFWLYAGLGWFSSGLCTSSHDAGPYPGNYGYCTSGATSGQPVNNLPGGNRSGYQEAKLWNYGGNTARDYQERIFYR